MLSLHSVPALSIGLIVGFYWARVIKLVLKLRRATGRAANFVPPEKTGRALRIVWYPTVALWVLHPLQVALWSVAFVALRPLFGNLIVQFLAAAVALGCLIATMICWRKMGRAWRMGIDPGEKNPLVVTGPFAFVRHPIYTLSQTMMLASVIAVPTPLMIALGAIHLGFMQWEARREERHMLGVHGEIYGQYIANVGRFVPRSLKPWTPGA